MFERQTEGAVLCPSCRQLVSVRDPRCFHCGRPYPGMWGFAGALRSLGEDLGFVPLVLWGCGALYLAMLAVNPGGIGMRGLGFLSPSGESLFLFGASGSLPVFQAGRWWTVLSATWLHGGVLHILFNMMWVRDLGPATAHLYGPGRAVILYVVSGIVGFAASSAAGWIGLPWPLQGGTLTVGASASIFGLLGALVWYGRRAGSRVVGGQALRFALILGAFGLVIPNIDNWAHLGGFAGGYGLARWFDPLRPDRPDHLIAALGLLAASALAVVVSVVHGLQFLR